MASAKTGVAIVTGFAELGPDGRYYNAAIFIDPSGRRIVYRKSHLYGSYEKGLFSPGTEGPSVFHYSGMALGMLVCFDVEFPEMVRILAQQGAQLVLVPTAIVESPFAAFTSDKIVPVRAFENQVRVFRKCRPKVFQRLMESSKVVLESPVCCGREGLTYPTSRRHFFVPRFSAF